MTTKRIAPWVKAIADAHLTASENKSFTYESIGELILKTEHFDKSAEFQKEVLIEMLKSGVTISQLLENAANIGGSSITSSLYSSVFGYNSEAYKKAVRNGFKKIFQP